MTDYTLANRIAVGRTAEVFALEQNAGRVAKVFFPGFESNAAKEFSIAQTLESLEIGAPRAFGTADFDGRPGMILERVEGPPLLQFLSQKPWTTRAIGRMLAEIHAPIHRASAEGLPHLRELLERQIEDADRLSTEQRGAALALLESLPNGDRLCHGDFHPGNILLGSDGPTTIDWNNVTAGPPLADVAKTVVLLRSGNLPHVPFVMKLILKVVRAVLVSSYVRRYDELAPFDRKALRNWQTVIAASRLSERIDNETDALLGMVRKGLRGS